MVGMALAAATSAESGMSRPGATSRLRANWSRSSHSSRTAANWRRSRIWWSPEVFRQGSTRGGGKACREDACKLLFGVFKLAVSLQQLDEFLAEFCEDFDVERCVSQPGFRQGGVWTSRQRSVLSRGRIRGVVQ